MAVTHALPLEMCFFFLFFNAGKAVSEFITNADAGDRKGCGRKEVSADETNGANRATSAADH